MVSSVFDLSLRHRENAKRVFTSERLGRWWWSTRLRTATWFFIFPFHFIDNVQTGFIDGYILLNQQISSIIQPTDCILLNSSLFILDTWWVQTLRHLNLFLLKCSYCIGVITGLTCLFLNHLCWSVSFSHLWVWCPGFPFSLMYWTRFVLLSDTRTLSRLQHDRMTAAGCGRRFTDVLYERVHKKPCVRGGRFIQLSYENMTSFLEFVRMNWAFYILYVPLYKARQFSGLLVCGGHTEILTSPARAAKPGEFAKMVDHDHGKSHSLGSLNKKYVDIYAVFFVIQPKLWLVPG